MITNTKRVAHQTEVMDRVVVTPEVAKEWLKRNTRNFRKLKPTLIDAYAFDMRRGLWTNTTATIAFHQDGTLIDGQHRLHAVVKAGVSVELRVIWNCDTDVIDPNQDKGSKRTAATYLQHQDVKHATTVAGSVRLLHKLNTAFNLGTNVSVNKYGKDITDSHVLSIIPKLGPLFFECVDMANSKKPLVCAPSTMASWLYLVASDNNARAFDFFMVFSRQTESFSTHPALLCREKLSLMDDRDRDSIFKCLFSAYNSNFTEKRSFIRPVRNICLTAKMKKALEDFS